MFVWAHSNRHRAEATEPLASPEHLVRAKSCNPALAGPGVAGQWELRLSCVGVGVARPPVRQRWVECSPVAAAAYFAPVATAHRRRWAEPSAGSSVRWWGLATGADQPELHQIPAGHSAGDCSNPCVGCIEAEVERLQKRCSLLSQPLGRTTPRRPNR